MPELPEVETVVRQLKNKIVGKTISKLVIKEAAVVDYKIRRVLPAKITGIQRRGKSIIFNLDNGQSLLAHLRMTGHFYYVKKKDEGYIHNKYLAGTFHFNDGSFLTHNTIRKFGSIKLCNEKKLIKELAKVGPEPLTNDFTASFFHDKISSYPGANIKNKLLDQSFIAGVGNIYAQEALYHAGIHPEKKVSQISKNKLIRLHGELQRVLNLSIKNNGTTVQNYSHIDGKGEFQNLLAVYSKDNCPKNHSLQKIKLAGRGTYYCPRCQK